MTIPAGAVAQVEEHGFVVLPGLVPAGELDAARRALPELFPTAAGFHDGTDDRWARYVGDEFAGIDPFPMASPELSLLCVHPLVVGVAEAMLGTDDIRLYAAEAWAKYTGAADYDQPLHRDFLNHTVLVPSADPVHRQLELFLFLSDVPEELGPPHYVSTTVTADLPVLPNWRAREEHRELFEAEVSSAGPAGTVVAYTPGTLHRGTRLTAPGGARYTIHVSYRPAPAEWGTRRGWADVSHDPAWYAFVDRASVRQLLLFGFPPPGHPFWTEATLAAMQLRYPSFRPADWA